MSPDPKSLHRGGSSRPRAFHEPHPKGVIEAHFQQVPTGRSSRGRLDSSELAGRAQETTPRSHVPLQSHANALRRRRRFLEKSENPLRPCLLSRTGQGRRRNRRVETRFSGGCSRRVGLFSSECFPGVVLSLSGAAESRRVGG